MALNNNLGRTTGCRRESIAGAGVWSKGLLEVLFQTDKARENLLLTPL